jgi:hypothetical protein
MLAFSVGSQGEQVFMCSHSVPLGSGACCVPAAGRAAAADAFSRARPLTAAATNGMILLDRGMSLMGDNGPRMRLVWIDPATVSNVNPIMLWSEPQLIAPTLHLADRCLSGRGRAVTATAWFDFFLRIIL